MFSNYDLEDVGMVFPTSFANLVFHPSTRLFVHMSDSVQTFHMSVVIFESSPSHVSIKYSLNIIT